MARRALFIFCSVISTLVVMSVSAIPLNSDFQKADARTNELIGLRHYLPDVRNSLLEELFSFRFPRLYFRAWKRTNTPQNDKTGSATESAVIDSNISQIMNEGNDVETFIGISNAQENGRDGGDTRVRENPDLNNSIFLPNELEDLHKTALKRSEIDCDMENITYNMLLHYFKTGKMCGERTGKIRFGLGG